MTIFDINKSTVENEALDELKALIDNNNSMKGYTKEYSEVWDKYIELQKKFEKTLTTEQKQEYASVDSACLDKEIQSNNEEFIHGFKTAARIFIDCFR